ncbi:MAG: DUF4167 domain-containing protein [Hyphomicrobiales bacterium]
MRQGQHPKKNRGRNRRPSSPTNRVFESNGPDVKIRGNASHVSEKYLTLARDAQSSGDPVAAENYLQHAEHYLRIIAASQAQQQQQSQNQPCAPEQSGRGAGGRNNGPARSRTDARQANGDGRDAEDTRESVSEARAEDGGAETEAVETVAAEGSAAEETVAKRARRPNGKAKAKEAPEAVADDVEPPEENVEEAAS